MATSWSEAIVAETTLIKSSHIIELKNALNTERQRRSLAVFTLPGTQPAAGVVIDDGHITTIRDNISGFSSFSPGEAISQGVTTIKKTHIDELRTKITALEGHAKVGGATDCKASCTGLCVGCSGTCTGACTSCSGGCSGCSGCSGGCSGTCSGTCSGGCSLCTGCTGSCSGGCSSCTGGCSGGCSSCSGGCSGGCSGACAGCQNF